MIQCDMLNHAMPLDRQVKSVFLLYSETEYFADIGVSNLWIFCGQGAHFASIHK